jgi:hypothetical protein
MGLLITGLLLIALLPPTGGAPADLDLRALLPSAREAARDAALAEIVDSEDERYVAVLLDLLVTADTPDEWYAALDALSPFFGEDTRAIESPWRTLTERRLGLPLAPLPPGYAAFKAELLAQEVDPAYRRFLGPGIPSRIRLDQIQWGGVPVDGIPALTDPKTLGASQASYLEDNAPVFGIQVNGEARAYPTQILDWHEMANDVIGGVPIALSWCTLCGAAIAYRAERGEPGVRQILGSSGLLYRSNKLMYDAATDSLWNQLTGRAVVGTLAGADDAATLERVFVRTTTWGAWKRDHPDTRVLAPSTGWERDYSAEAAYGDYFASARTMFPVPVGKSRYLPKERIYIAYLDSETYSTPLAALAPGRPIRLGPPERAVTIVSLEAAPKKGASEKPNDRLHPYHDAMAFATGSRVFRQDAGGALIDQHGTKWDRTDRALVSPDGVRCPRVQAHPAFGFAWNAILQTHNAPDPTAEDAVSGK